jgi:Fe-S oxidoreductase
MNAVARSPLGGFAKRLLDIHPSRTLPELATEPFTARIAGLQRRERNGRQTKPDVLLFADTFTNYFQPQIAEAAYEALAGAGCRVQVLRRHVCCGRPLYDFGMLDRARQYLIDLMEALREELSTGIPIVVLEPSCASVFKEEAPNLLAGDERAQRLRAQTMLLSEFLVKHASGYRPAEVRRKILLHVHCHHRAVFGVKDEVALLNATGATVSVLDSGCCGMAGPYGFERKSYGVSQVLAERTLLPAVRASDPGTLIVTDGFSCREQISQNTGKRGLHLAEVLAGRI